MDNDRAASIVPGARGVREEAPGCLRWQRAPAKRPDNRSDRLMTLPDMTRDATRRENVVSAFQTQAEFFVVAKSVTAAPKPTIEDFQLAENG